MTIERGLRLTAVAIAIAAFIDPPVVLSGRARPRLGFVTQAGPSMALPADDGSSRRLVATQVVAALKRDLEPEFDVVDLPGGRVESVGELIVVGDHYPQDALPGLAHASTVTISGAMRPNVRIAGLDAPSSVPPGTSVRLRITADAVGMSGSRSEIVVRTSGAAVGRASHDWTRDEERWTADIAAVPLSPAPFAFDISASSTSRERTDLDNHASVGIDRAERLRVFVLEARPSWASAFVRRALEGDPRFEVVGVSRVSPRVLVTTGEGFSGADRVERFDTFDVVIVGGLDEVSASAVTALEHFATVRGGAVALLPDSWPATSPVVPLLPAVRFAERLLDRPAALSGPSASFQLEASELLQATEVPRDATVLVRNPGSGEPIVWTIPAGDGRVLFAGAMDAWRFRGAPGGGFDRFWRSAIAGLALETRPAVEVGLTPGRAAPGERVELTVRVRRLERDRLGDRLAISARAGDEIVRLWPDAQQGVFRGSFVVDSNAIGSSLMVAATVDGVASGRARLSLDRNVRDADGPPLALLAASHGGTNVGPGDLAALERYVRRSANPPVERQTHHPMRSVWWFAPFAACLCAEWWLRRSAGRR